MADEPDRDCPSAEPYEKVKNQDSARLSGRQQMAAKWLGRGDRPGHVARRLRVHANRIGIWRKNPAFAALESEYAAEVNARIDRSLDIEWTASVKKVAEVRDHAFENTREFEGVPFQFIDSNLVREANKAAKTLIDARMRVHLARMMERAKSKDSAESAEDRAAAIRAAMVEMDERSGELG